MIFKSLVVLLHFHGHVGNTPINILTGASHQQAYFI